ncbi:MAG: bifunctional ornithine acetyltransferase/N-acetylglutamate synthase, partial [Desulfovibrio sp.]|nr:bifunctional ornithine acetyltransferase/N-acetylglutamate synthase [Desulfovibrio sp.]
AAESLGSRSAEGFTRAFMTTDAFPKFVSRTLEMRQGQMRLTVMAKGAGMICPNMATMLCVVLTDARLDRADWQRMFDDCVDLTFNRVTVDGDTSTNDTILGLANGASGIDIKSGADWEKMRSALLESLGAVSRMLVRDGEGAKRVIHIKVAGAKNEREAEIVARAVGNSQLVKTAIYGGDANWGRIINAVGYSGAEADPAEVSLSLCGIELFREGQPLDCDPEAQLDEKMQADTIEIDLGLGHGPGRYELWASDLGHEYVSLNADYRS